MPTASSSPPSASPTPSERWVRFLSLLAAPVLSFAILGGVLLWLLSSQLFIQWEIDRLYAAGLITIEDPHSLAQQVRDYLVADREGLIQAHRLTNPERHHLRSVKLLLSRLHQWVVVSLLCILGCLLIARIRQQWRVVVLQLLGYSALCNMAFVLLLASALLIVGFGPLFIALHWLLFPEVDWVFPSTAILTSLYPPQLFRDAALIWLALVTGTSLPLLFMFIRGR